MKGLRKARKRQATHPRYGAAPRKSGSRLWVRYVIRCSETCDRHRCYSVSVGSCSPAGKKPMTKVIASLIAALVLTFTGAMVGGGAQAAAIAPEGLGTAGDAIATIDKVQFFYRGRRYCWYWDGWRGPGWYWCGYEWRRGFGWGGPIGWHGWRRPSRPAVRPPTRPNRPGVNRPGHNRPGANRPGHNRPGANRPGNRPGGGAAVNRPGGGGGGGGNRPSAGGGGGGGGGRGNRGSQ